MACRLHARTRRRTWPVWKRRPRPSHDASPTGSVLGCLWLMRSGAWIALAPSLVVGTFGLPTGRGRGRAAALAHHLPRARLALRSLRVPGARVRTTKTRKPTLGRPAVAALLTTASTRPRRVTILDVALHRQRNPQRAVLVLLVYEQILSLLRPCQLHCTSYPGSTGDETTDESATRTSKEPDSCEQSFTKRGKKMCPDVAGPSGLCNRSLGWAL